MGSELSAEEVKQQRTNLAAISCETADPLCIAWGVSDVPTMILVKDDVGYVYQGSREYNSFVKFIEGGYAADDVEKRPLATKEDVEVAYQKEQMRIAFNNSYIPSPLQLGAIVIALIFALFLLVGYCCAPTPDLEEDEQPATQTGKEGTKGETKEEKTPSAEKDNESVRKRKPKSAN